MSEQIATRDAYGKALAELGDKHPEIVVLDADLSGSTKTAVFGKKFPHRFFNMGVAEQDMMGTAAGFALSGKIAFASTFAIFATGRAWEIVRQSIVYPHLNVKICASHAGLTVGEDGASHQTIADIAVMRVLPGMTVLVPADAVETENLVAASAVREGPVYMRLSRAKSPLLFKPEDSFEIGKAKILTSGNDVAIVTCGLMTTHAWEAAKILEKEGIGARVVHCGSVKPLDREAVLKAARETRALLTVEEHSIIGGLGSAVAEVLSEALPKRVVRMGVHDEFGQSGSAEALLKHYKLMPEDIADAARRALKEN